MNYKFTFQNVEESISGDSASLKRLISSVNSKNNGKIFYN